MDDTTRSIIRNVKAAPNQSGPELGLENLDGMANFPDRLVFNEIFDKDDDYPNEVHNLATVPKARDQFLIGRFKTGHVGLFFIRAPDQGGFELDV